MASICSQTQVSGVAPRAWLERMATANSAPAAPQPTTVLFTFRPATLLLFSMVK